MDDYMREMGDLKTLVTKTLEKKGVLARIRAELRANVFQAIEEQDREAENNGASSFALLGKCSERAKQLHASHAGKLLMALVCEYFEWCELEHTLKVFLPELNQPRSYMRSELEELLGLKDKTKLGDAESQPLLLSVVESYLKAEEKPTATANKVRTNSRGRAGDAGDGVLMSKLSGEFSKDNGKGGTKLSPNLEDFPAPKRTSSVPAFGGLPRSSATAPGRSSGGSGIDVHNGFNSLMSVGSATEISGAQTRGSRDNSRSSTTHTKGREYYRREEDEVKSGSNGSKKKENAWREEEYNDHYVDSPTVSQSYSDKGGPMSVVQPANRSGSHSQSRKGLSVDDMSNAVGNLHLEDDSASDPSSRHSSTSRENVGSRNRHPASASTATSAPSNYRKKNSSAYFYSDSDNDNSFEGIEEDLEDEVEEHNRRNSHFSAVK